MGPLCVVGIDALDPDLLDRWGSSLPTFSRLRNEGKLLRLRSTFPPDSIPAWTTIYTGVDPSQHGGLEYINYLDIRAGKAGLDNSRVRGRSFWDVVSASGRRVLVLNPFLAYPAWPVEGLMVSGPVFVDGSASMYPPGAISEAELPELGGMVEFPTAKTLESFYEHCVAATRRQAAFFAHQLASRRWDLSHVLFLTLDRVKHFYWRFEDEGDPYHERWPVRAHPIRDFYVLMDELLADVLRALPVGAALMVLSDHGHQRRCTRVFYVNEALRRAGLLAAPTGWRAAVSPSALVERAKNVTLDLSHRLAWEDGLSRVARWVPKRKALKRGDHVIRRDESIARASSFGGVNPFGGVELNEPRMRALGLERGEVVQRVVRLLEDARDSATGRRVTRWARPREVAVPPGARIDAYPDVLFELDPAYGVSWSIFRSLFGPSVTHRKISGGHTAHGVLLATGAAAAPVERRADLAVTDVHDIVLGHFGLARPASKG